MSGMAEHLRHAIAVNRHRSARYAVATDGRSAPLSAQLIGLERATLPIAMVLDRRAQPFNRRGIDVVVGDFVPMHPLPPWDQAPRWTGVSTAPARRDLRRTLRALARDGRGMARDGRWMDLANHVAECLADLHTLEHEQAAHFAMTAHLLESIGFAARNADRTTRADPDVQPLARDLMRVQLVGLRVAIALDLQAQHLHTLNVGILVNDVPAIPFP